MKIKKLALSILSICMIVSLSSCGTKGIETYNKGVQLFQEMKYGEAILEFQKAVDENPDFGEAYMYMGRAYNLLQQYDKSIECYQKALGIFKQGKFNAGVQNLPDNKKIAQIEEVWLPYSQIQQKIQKGIQLTDIEIQKQAEIIKRLDPK